MFRAFHPLCRAVALLSLLAAACSYPTDNSAGAWVTITAPPLIIRGADTVLTAHVFLLEHGRDTVEVKNVEVTWTTGDPTLASITPLTSRTARVTGVNAGFVTITASAPTLQSSKPMALVLRVSNPLALDGISPDVVKYGEQLTVTGPGAENVDVLFLGSQALALNSFSSTKNDTLGTGTSSFWVPFPARSSDTITAIGNGVITGLRHPITVIDTMDLFDPNSSTPAVIDIDQRPYRNGSSPGTLPYYLAFFNPALYAEDPRTAPFRDDWFRFTTAHPDSAFTFVYVAPGLFGREATYLAAPVTASTLFTPDWSYGSGHYNCKGNSFTPGEEFNNGFEVAFTRLPPGGVDLVSLFVDRGTYEVIIVGLYLAPNGTHPDRFGGANTCDLADSNFANPALKIDLSSTFSDTLTIDNAFGLDWLRFHVAGPGTQTVLVKMASRKFPDITGIPSVNLYVLNVPTTSAPLSVLQSATGGGLNKSLSVSLAAGDYYLVVHDSVGVPARYSLCMTVSASCALTPLPDVAGPASAPNVSRRATNPYLNFDSLLATPRKRRTRQ
jgi:hypothetical protein